KIEASLKLYLRGARSLLRDQSPKEVNAEEIVTALEQLQLVEMMAALQSYSRIENEEFRALVSVMDAELTTERLDEFSRQLLGLSVKTMRAGGGRILICDQGRSEPRIVIDSAGQSSILSKLRRVETAIRTALKNSEPVFLHSRRQSSKA